MKTDPTKENTKLILYDINITYHRIKDYNNLRSQNIILYIIYNIIIRVIIKSLSQIKDYNKKSSNSRQSFYNNHRILS